MKNQRLAMLIGLLNLVILLFFAAKPSPDVFEKIRVKEFELVDNAGTVRAAIKVEPDGEVILRLRDKTGTIRVKLGANEDGSGLVLLNNSTEVGIHALAKKSTSTLVVVGKDGKKREL
ncbi:hypothetical protein [Emticicia sp.]|uniref:hypothetical protein n=1 Tax=Emticicia sp. TaxID=1930953 RepID=UPI003750165D